MPSGCALPACPAPGSPAGAACIPRPDGKSGLNWLARLLHRAELEPADARRLEAWRRLPAPERGAQLRAGRFVVVDVETTGLDLGRDRLIAIGAVAVAGGKVCLGDSFETILRQERASARDNILVHGIGGERQRKGLPPEAALLDFLDYLGAAPLVAYHVAFDETMIRRAMREHLGLAFRRPWLDLAAVMPALLPAQARRCRGLDDWAGRFGIANYARHSALADALATAQLFLAAAALADAQGSTRYRQLQELEQAQRWLQKGH